MMLQPPALIRRWQARWSALSLATRFALAGGFVMVLAALIVGSIVANRIRDVVVRNTANATALYMESFISPLSQELAEGDTLSQGARRALDEIFANTPLGERVASFKIWKPGGLLVDASNKDLVGQTFEMTENMRLAFDGQVRADFEDLRHPEDMTEGEPGVPLLEIYSPIREVWSGRVIAVAEFYEYAAGLKQDLARARFNSWATVVLVLSLIGGSLYAIVLGGSRTIDRQLVSLTELSARNTALRLRVQSAAARFSAMQDQALQQVGADLHDGPAQLMAFAALRLDNLQDAAASQQAEADFAAVEKAMADAIRDIRNIARGLSLPDIDKRPLADLVRAAVDSHTARTGTKVTVDLTVPDGIRLPTAVNICVYRFVQEGLTNAWRHAAGAGQAVRLCIEHGVLHLSVLDAGPGLPSGGRPGTGTGTGERDGGLGLIGLRDRVESLGGQFSFANRIDTGSATDIPPRPRSGTDLHMTLDLKGAT